MKKDGVVKETYAYDNAGNITSFNNGNGKNYTLTYADIWGWKDLLTAVDGETITYDNLGNPLTYYNGYALNYYFTWTEGRRLATYTYDDKTTTYEYDHTGLRTMKTNPDGTYFVYHIADGRYVGETRYNSNNAPYLYMQYIYDENDTIYGISLWQPGQSTAWEYYYFVKNLQGDVHRIYRASDNALVATYSYDAWGNVLSSNSLQTFYGKAVSQLNPFRYRGYYFDNETYFYYLQSRYYDPAIGRFINADGFVSTGQGVLGYNMFAYCGNNPVCNTDSSGMRYCAGTTVANESSTERGISCRWQKYIELDNPTILDKWKVCGVEFVPDSSGNGGQIINSYLIHNSYDMTAYAMYLMNASKYSTYFSGSIEGFVFEWDVHNIAYQYYDLIGDHENAIKAKSLDVGSTIYADNHGFFTYAMLRTFEILYPNQAQQDLFIHNSLLGE